MSIATVTERCAEIQLEIDGIKKAFSFEETPNDLVDVQIPAFTNFPMAAEYDSESAGTHHAYETTTYQMMLWIEPMQRPPDAARKAKFFAQYAPLVRDAFLARPGLGGLTGVRQARLTMINQPQVTPYAGTDYMAMTATLRVVEQVQVTYADGD